MDGPAYHSSALIQVIRDRRGIVIGRLEEQRLSGKLIARDAQGVVVGSYDRREGTTRDNRGVVVAHGDVLAALVVRR